MWLDYQVLLVRRSSWQVGTNIYNATDMRHARILLRLHPARGTFHLEVRRTLNPSRWCCLILLKRSTCLTWYPFVVVLLTFKLVSSASRCDGWTLKRKEEGISIPWGMPFTNPETQGDVWRRTDVPVAKVFLVLLLLWWICIKLKDTAYNKMRDLL